MGYNAYGEGNIKLSLPCKNAEAFYINAMYDAGYEAQVENRAGNVVDLWVQYPNENWHEDRTLEMLEDLKPVTLKGCICFSGEDDTYWRYIFRNGEWHAERGHIAYEYADETGSSDPITFGALLQVLESFTVNVFCADTREMLGKIQVGTEDMTGILGFDATEYWNCKVTTITTQSWAGGTFDVYLKVNE